MTPSSTVTAFPAPAAATRRRNIIAVASGKGGVGKTWFSITLAHALARAGRKALLFDGDLGLANVDVQLGMTAQRDLGSVITGEATLAQVAKTHEAGFDIIAGRSGTGMLATLPASRLMALRAELQLLSQNYDWVVLDLGAGIERTVRLLMGHSRACLVLTTDEPTAITDAYAYIKVTAARAARREHADRRQHGLEPARGRARLRHAAARLPRIPQDRAAARRDHPPRRPRQGQHPPPDGAAHPPSQRRGGERCREHRATPRSEPLKRGV